MEHGRPKCKPDQNCIKVSTKILRAEGLIVTATISAESQLVNQHMYYVEK